MKASCPPRRTTGPHAAPPYPGAVTPPALDPSPDSSGSSHSRSSTRPGWARVLTAIGLALGFVGAGGLGSTASAATPEAVPLVSEDAPEPPPGSPTVLVGVVGLRWTDVNPTTMPTLWSMVGDGAVASIPGGISGQGACPREAWMTLSAGRMLPAEEPAPAEESEDPTPTEEPDAEEDSSDPEPACDPVPEIATTGTGIGVGTVPGWETPPTQAQDTTPLVGTPGTLGAALAEAGACTTAVGPGAALMLADKSGTVDRYASSLAGLDAADLTACDVVVVDAGTLPEGSSDRRTARQALDRDLDLLREHLPRGARVIVAGIADTVPLDPDLQVVVDWRDPGHTPRWLTSDSTRRQGQAHLLDLAHTVAQAGGADTKEFLGSPLTEGDARRINVTQTVENLIYLQVLAQTIQTLMPVLVGVMFLTVTTVVVWLLLARRRTAGGTDPTDGTGSPRPGPLGRRVVTAILLVISSAPVAASLAAFSRWWVQPAPMAVLTVSLAVATAGVAIVSWGISRRLPRSPLTLAAAVAGVTWLILTIDGLTGTVLQQGSVLGSSPKMGARFYGFNNMTFAVYAVAALVLAGCVASFLRRGRRRIAVIAAIGIVSTVVDGSPSFGAEFGGAFALVSAFTVLGMLTARLRLTARRIGLVALITVVVVALVAIVDWLLPGATSHIGAFVQQVLEGQGMEVIWRKALGAWATIANPAGAVALLLTIAAGFAVLRPRRCGLAMVDEAYAAIPLLRPIAVSLVVAAVVGSILNDSGIIIAVMFLLVAVPILLGSILQGSAPTVEDSPRPAGRPGMVSVLCSVGGGFLVVVMLASGVLSSLTIRSTDPTATAGEEASASRGDVLSDGDGIVVIGTMGVAWNDIDPQATPAIAALLTDGAAAGGVSQTTGAASRCAVGGWLALSSGHLATVTNTRTPDRTWDCPTPTPVRDGEVTRVEGWSDLVALQKGSSYQATLGALGDQLAPTVCATAVGPGAALALATTDGTVQRYRTLEEALSPSTDAFDCPVTLVDAGDATWQHSSGIADTLLDALGSTMAVLPIDPDSTPTEFHAPTPTDIRREHLAAVDRTISDVVNRVPAGTTVLVVDLAGTPSARPVLGIALAKPGTDGPDQAHYLTSSATRSDGIARALDVPATLLGAAGLVPAEPIQDTPFAYGSLRPSETAAATAALAELTTRDLVRRDAYVYFVDVPLYAGLVLAGLCLVGGRIRRIAPRWRARLGAWARGAGLFLASLPTAAFLVSLSGWWRFERPGLALTISAVVAAGAVAGVAALAPRRPLWLAPGIVAGITFVMLTVDGVIGTPLNRASPLGAAPTFGARFYGFGNPTFSVYTVAALILVAALAQWLVGRGRRRWAVGVVAVIGAASMLVTVWPTFGADLGGGLVIIPGFAIVAIAASGASVTWRRVALVGAAGVGAVAAIGVIDWLRPAADRSHLGRFVGQVIEGEAFGTLFRKAGYALRSVLGGAPVWLTILVLVAVGVMLFASGRFSPAWWVRAQAAWPLLRSATLGLWVVLVAGSFVNDFGVRIAMVALIPALPLYTVIGLSAPRLGTREASESGRGGTGADATG